MGINEVLFTPSYLETLISTAKETATEIFQNIDICWLNGEVVSSWLQHNLEPFMTNTNIYNLYSISECHDVAVYKLHPKDQHLEKEGVVPVGHVLPNVEAIVLDNNKKPVKHGDKGEIYINSIGLANEYINRPDLNKERFIESAKSPIKKRIYKTGDYGKLSEDGQLITIYGRCDYIIKLRGYTLSLPFIESVIKDKLDIMHCVVNKTGDTRMSESLVAYLEIPSNKKIDFSNKWELNDNNKPSKKLLDRISPYLAHYMLPKHIVILDKIPLNRYSNKLDRNKLPIDHQENQQKQIKEIETLKDYKLLWSIILNTPEEYIQADSCFFKLGGSSLLSMLLIKKLKDFGFNIRISDFIRNSQLEHSFQSIMNDESFDIEILTKQILSDINNAFINLKNKIENSNSLTNKAENKNVLITGATGFLGSHILKSLISDKKVKTIFCLVRASDKKHA